MAKLSLLTYCQVHHQLLLYPLRQRSSAITKLLTPPAIASKEAKGKDKAPGGARVLTCNDSLALLQEKEKKKKDDEEIKMERKLE